MTTFSSLSHSVGTFFNNYGTSAILSVRGNLAASLTLLGLGIGGHAAYAYGTKKTVTLTINKKCQFVGGYVAGGEGTTQSMQMVVDSKNNLYNVPNSLWYWQWYSPELWTGLKDGKTVNVTIYGIRHGILGLFPNIVEVKSEVTDEKQ